MSVRLMMGGALVHMLNRHQIFRHARNVVRNWSELQSLGLQALPVRPVFQSQVGSTLQAPVMGVINV